MTHDDGGGKLLVAPSTTTKNTLSKSHNGGVRASLGDGGWHHMHAPIVSPLFDMLQPQQLLVWLWLWLCEANDDDD
jgi:hypothetical protein